MSACAMPAGWAARSALTGSFLANGFGTGVWAALQPLIKARLGLDDWQLSNALLAYAVGAALAMPAAAFVSARLGPGRTTVLSGTLFGMFLALLPSVAGLAALSVVALAMGATTSVQSVAMNAYGSRLEARWGTPIMSSLHGAYSIGALSGAALAGVLIALCADLGMWIPAGLIVGGNLLTLMPLGPGERHRTAGAVFAKPARGMIGLCVLILFGVLIESSMLNWSAVYLSGVIGVSASTAASGFVGFHLGMAAMRLSGDAFVRRLGSARVVLIGGVVATAGLALVALAPSLIVAIVGFVLVGMGIANISPTTFAAAARLTASPASGVAMVSAGAYVSYIVGPPLIGSVATWTDLRMGMALLVLSGVMIILTARALRRTS